eukprot:GGOE01002401.1.p1 GENE.GGOE01002401.1~~GGOE01002401.1.p1  ORF type:complete len:271 (-),score=37.71 GGOE01002401.1:69-779(-)
MKANDPNIRILDCHDAGCWVPPHRPFGQRKDATASIGVPRTPAPWLLAIAFLLVVVLSSLSKDTNIWTAVSAGRPSWPNRPKRTWKEKEWKTYKSQGCLYGNDPGELRRQREERQRNQDDKKWREERRDWENWNPDKGSKARWWDEGELVGEQAGHVAPRQSESNWGAIASGANHQQWTVEEWEEWLDEFSPPPKEQEEAEERSWYPEQRNAQWREADGSDRHDVRPIRRRGTWNE